MKRQGFRTEELKAELERALGFGLRSLVRLDGASALNFKATRASDGAAFAVKLFPPERDELRRSLLGHLEHLARDGRAKTTRRIHADGLSEFRGCGVVCCGWCEGERVFPDRLSPDELTAFLDDYLSLSAALQGAEPVLPRYPTERWWAHLRKRMAERPFLRSFRETLLREIPLEDVSYREELVRTIHGDFHHGNSHFRNGRLVGTFDLEEFRRGYPAEDIVRYFICAAVHLKWYERGRRTRRLHRAFASAVAHLPYSAHEWQVAVNGLYLRKAIALARDNRLDRRGMWSLRRNLPMYAGFRRIAEQVSLERLVAGGLGASAVALAPLAVECACPVYRAEVVGRPPVFVKVAAREAAERTLSFLKAAGGLPFLPRPVVPEALAFGSRAVLCLEWKEAKRVNAEDMTDAQLAGFLDGCRALSGALAAYDGPVAPPAEEDSPAAQHAALRDHARRHPLAGRLLRPLLEIPEAERLYGDRPLVVIHGDLQPKNYGFDGDRLAAVYDTDDLTRGLACEDAAYAFTERARRAELSAEGRRRLTELLLRLVAASPWPRGEWLIAVNHARLRIAARRLASHPDSAFIAFDIARRDRPLRLLAEALGGHHA